MWYSSHSRRLIPGLSNPFVRWIRRFVEDRRFRSLVTLPTELSWEETGTCSKRKVQAGTPRK